MIKQNVTNKHVLEKDHIAIEKPAITIQSINDSLSQEVTDRIAGVDQEESDRITAIGSVQSNINQEVIDRTNGDSGFSNRIDSINDKIDTIVSDFSWNSLDVQFGTDTIADVRHMPYDNDIIIAVGGNGKVSRSYDGVSWIDITASVGFGAVALRYVGYSPTRIFIGGATSIIKYSEDSGITWVSLAGTPPINGSAIAYSPLNGGRLFIVQSGASDFGCYTSDDDGDNWTYRADPVIIATVSKPIVSIAVADTIGGANGTIVVGSGTDGEIAYSTDHGVTWTLAIISLLGGSGCSVLKIAFSKDLSRFVAVSYDGSWIFDGVFYSNDGINWTKVDDARSNDNVISVVYSDSLNMFMLVENTGKVWTSFDGITWSYIGLDVGNWYYAITYSDIVNKFIIAGPSGDAWIINYPNILETALKNPLNAGGSAPIYVCRTWINFDADGTGTTVNGSGNISSVNRTAAGQYTINFINTIVGANYSINGICTDFNISTIELTKSYVKIEIINHSGSNVDTSNICITILK